MGSAYLVYRPTQVFRLLAAALLGPALVLAVRYLYIAAFLGDGRGHLHSVVASGVLATCGVLLMAAGFLAHLLAINRRLLEEIRYIERSRQYAAGRSCDRPPAESETLPTHTDILTVETYHGSRRLSATHA